MCKNLKLIKKINNKIIHNDGTIDNFSKQLLSYNIGTFDRSKLLVISDNSKSINFVLKNHKDSIDNPLVINVSTVDKFSDKHPESLLILADIETYLKNSVLAFDSIKNNSKIVVLDAKDGEGNSNIVVCRIDKSFDGAVIYVNEITSAYGRKNLINLMNKTWEKNLFFYKTKKTEQFIKAFSTQLHQDLTNVLSINYDRQSFNKSQVSADLNKEEKL